MMRIFLSHAHRDQDLASAVGRALSNAGVGVFDPGLDIGAGANWRAAIKAAIESSDALIVIVGSPDAAASSWVSYEAAMAEAKGKPVIVLASESYPLSDLPIDLESYETLPFDPSDPAAVVRSILQALPAPA